MDRMGPVAFLMTVTLYHHYAKALHRRHTWIVRLMMSAACTFAIHAGCSYTITRTSWNTGTNI